MIKKITIGLIIVIIILIGSYILFDNQKFGGRHLIPSSSKFGIGTNTPLYYFVAGVSTSTFVSGTNTTTNYIYSYEPGKGGQIILEDTDGVGCSSISILNGIIDSFTITCPTE